MITILRLPDRPLLTFDLRLLWKLAKINEVHDTDIYKDVDQEVFECYFSVYYVPKDLLAAVLIVKIHIDYFYPRPQEKGRRTNRPKPEPSSSLGIQEPDDSSGCIMCKIETVYPQRERRLLFSPCYTQAPYIFDVAKKKATTDAISNAVIPGRPNVNALVISITRSIYYLLKLSIFSINDCCNSAIFLKNKIPPGLCQMEFMGHGECQRN